MIFNAGTTFVASSHKIYYQPVGATTNLANFVLIPASGNSLQNFFGGNAEGTIGNGAAFPIIIPVKKNDIYWYETSNNITNAVSFCLNR